MEWKNNTFMKVEGMCSRTGVFPAITAGDPNDTAPFEITPDLLKTLFSKFNKPINFRISHLGKDTVGYLTALGYDESNDSVHYKGFVYDPDGQIKVSKEGFDKVSLEFGDVTNNPEITGAVFTRRPAIPDTDVHIDYMYFSQSLDESAEIKKETGGLKMAEMKELVQEEIAKQKELAAAEERLAQMAKVESDYNRIKAEHDATLSKNKDIESKYTAIVTKQVKELENELAAMGFDDPQNYLTSLDIDTRLSALGEVKARFASKQSKMTSPPSANLKPERGAEEKTKDAVLAELGLPDTYKKYLRRK
jgi:hypothetical protein